MEKGPKKTFRISGRVVDRKTRQGAGGLRVEAWDKDLIFDDLVGSAVTDAEGNFLIEFDQSYFKVLFLDRQPDLFFKVFRGDVLITSTEDSVLWNVRAGESAIVIEVEIPVVVKPKAAPLVVKGRVTLSDGSPFAGGLVRAFDKDLRSEELLGEQLADKAGGYRIPYRPEQFKRAEKTSADLVVRVFDAADQEGRNPLANSSVIFNSQPDHTVDLVISNAVRRVQSEYVRLVAEVVPLLDGVTPAQLQENSKHQDVSFLAGETGIDRKQIEFFAAACRLREQTRLDAEIFYGMAREGLPTDLPALLKCDEQQWTDALLKAIEANIIEPLTLEQRSDAITLLRSLEETQGLHQPLEPGAGSLGALLETAGLPSDLQFTYLRTRQTYGGDETAFSSRLANQGFSAKQIASARLSMTLGALVGNSAPLVTALRQRGIAAPEELATLEVNDWEKLGQQAGQPPAELQQQATRLVNAMAERFPNARVLHRLAIDPPAKLPTVAGFFSQSETRQSFDLGTTDVDSYLRAHKAYDPALAGQLKTIQRMYKLSADENELRSLLGANILSAGEIVANGRNAFQAAVGVQLAGQTDLIYGRAEHTWAKAISLATDPALNIRGKIAGTGTITATGAQAAPTWRNLFGPHDLDAVAEWRSLTGPLAYLADLLDFLGQADNNAGTQTAQQALFQRRPDLKTLKFSRTNAKIELLEIDLVNELLAQQIAPLASTPQTRDVAASEEENLVADLALTPEYHNPAAEAVLAAANPAWEPWLEQVTLCLKVLGIERDTLLSLMVEPADDQRTKDRNDLVAQLSTLGILVTVDKLKEWAGPPTKVLADSLEGAIRSCWRDEWRARLKPIHDTLRESRREALAGYLIAHGGPGSKSDLSARLLIDIEVGAGRTTTRIAQATVAIQQFVQRVLMNLEDEAVALSPQGIVQWEWVGHYKNWKQHRQIFLHPEDQLRPELRDDKTPFFKEFESDLLQNQITPEYIEQAIRSYLVKLDSIARLQVCGVYQDQGDNGQTTLYVFARTREVPNVYYFRKRVQDVSWTAWEKIDLDIEGDQLIPVVFNRRLYLFWPVFSEHVDLHFGKIEEALLTLVQTQMNLGLATAGGAIDLVTRMVGKVGDFFKVLLGSLPVPKIDQAKSDVDKLIGQFGDDLKNALGQFKLVFSRIEGLNLDPLTTGIDAKDINAVIRAVLQLGTVLFQKVQELLPTKELAIQLAWSELKDDSWLPKKISHDALQFIDLSGFLPYKKRAFDFYVSASETLRIDCYLPNRMSPSAESPLGIGCFTLNSANGTLTAKTQVDISTLEEAIKFETLLNEIQKTAAFSPNRFVEGRPVLPDDEPASPLRQTIERLLPDAPGVNDPNDPLVGLVAPIREGPAGFLDDAQCFFIDDHRPLFGERKWIGWQHSIVTSQIRLQPFYHPFASQFINDLDQSGIFGLFQLDVQQHSVDWFRSRYAQPQFSPVESLALDYPQETVDFSIDGAYSQYNWEIFVHIPVLIAARLTGNKRYREAQQWLHTIFDPTQRKGDAMQRYWRTPALNQAADQSLQAQIIRWFDPASDPSANSSFDLQIEAWQSDPFNPYVIARLRPTAFQKAVVMAYLDNLISWAENVAQRSDQESINEATQLHARALLILGSRPDDATASGSGDSLTFGTLQTQLRSTVHLQAIEERLPMAARPAPTRLIYRAIRGNAVLPEARKQGAAIPVQQIARLLKPLPRKDWLGIATSPSLVSTLDQQGFFGAPKDEVLLRYWDRIEQNLEYLRGLALPSHACRDLEL